MEVNYFTILYWFCHTSTWIRHRYTRVPHPELSSLLPPHIIPLGLLSAPAPSILYPASNLDWRFVSHMILYVSMPLPQIIPPLPSPTESKRLFYTSVSLLLSIIHETNRQSRFDAWYWMLGAGALRWPRGMVWGGKKEGCSGWGTRVYLWQIHVDVWQNQ